MKNILLDIFKDILERIPKYDVDYNPFPHIELNTPINIDDISDIKDMFNVVEKKSEKLEFNKGRTEYFRTVSDLNTDMLKLYKDIGEAILTKLNISLPHIPSTDYTLNETLHFLYWEDNSELRMNDIHLDYLMPHDTNSGVEVNENTQTTFSLQLYLPEDYNHYDLGTKLYTIPPYVHPLQADYPITLKSIIPHQLNDKCTMVKQIPFQPGNTFIHNSTLSSWHQAPTIPDNYIRKSIMLRWQYDLIPNKNSLI